MLKIYDDQIVYRFFEREKEEVAVIPGIESHWFYAPLGKIGNFVASGVSLSPNKRFCCGNLLVCPNCIQQNHTGNAMASLYVLVIGMVILLSADYVIKTVRSRLIELQD